MPYLLEVTDADLVRPLTEPENMTETTRAMFDGETPVRTKDVATTSGRN